MKNLKYLFFSLLATVAFAACQDDETASPEVDVENCYDVYFPEQDNADDLTLDPAAPTSLEFTVMRNNDKDAITVPVEILSSEENIFTASEVVFAEGQTETTFTVDFPNAALGTPYECTVRVTDPQYVSLYSDKPAFVSFSVLRAKWIQVDADKSISFRGKEYKGYEWYTEDIVTAFFNLTGATTFPVKVEVREDTIDEDYPNGAHGLAGLYRMIEPYGAGNPFNEPGDYVDGVNIEIDATDPQKVFIRQQKMGHNWGYGDFYISSLAYYYLRNPSQGDPDTYYGKIQNGAITFPSGALLVAMAEYDGGGLYATNNNGAFRLEICQDQVVDYSLTLTAGESVNGKLDIAAAFGADVAKVKYAFFEGSLSPAQANESSSDIDAGNVESQELAKPEGNEGVLTAELAETGVYTMIANIYDKDNALQGYEMISFGYVAAGDEQPVVISCGINITDKYAPQGFTSEDSAEIYIYGENIVSGSYALIEADKLAAIEDMDAYLLENGKEFTAAQLEAINGNGYSGVIGKLIGGTEYVLVVKAFNGYVSDYATASATTNGTPHPLKRAYTADDLYTIDGGKATLFKKWNYYAKCFNEAGNAAVDQREYLGQVEFKENTTDDDPTEEIDAIDVTGLTAHAGRQLQFDDTMTFMYDSDIVYTLGGQAFDATIQGSPLGILYTFNGLRVYPDITLNVALVGGVVEEGYLAFVSYPGYTQQGVEFNGFTLAAFTDNTYAEPADFVEIYIDPMLVDPAVDDKAPAQKSATAKTVSLQSLRNLAANAATPANFVELRGHERMRALIDEIHANKKAIRNAAQTIEPVAMPALGTAEAKVSFRSGLPKQSFDRSQLVKKQDAVRIDK